MTMAIMAVSIGSHVPWATLTLATVPRGNFRGTCPRQRTCVSIVILGQIVQLNPLLRRIHNIKWLMDDVEVHFYESLVGVVLILGDET